MRRPLSIAVLCALAFVAWRHPLLAAAIACGLLGVACLCVLAAAAGYTAGVAHEQEQHRQRLARARADETSVAELLVQPNSARQRPLSGKES